MQNDHAGMVTGHDQVEDHSMKSHGSGDYMNPEGAHANMPMHAESAADMPMKQAE